MEEKQIILILQPQDLNCIICCGHYTDPTTLPCGHTFCKQCIEKYWENSSKYPCPVCKKSFPTKPELNKNTDIAHLLEALQQLDSKAHERCPSCTGAGALKLCLNCMAPLCQEHVTLHREDRIRQRHLLVNLITATSCWPCRHHEKGLQYFCVSHSSPLCATCVLQHQPCQTFPLLELYQRKMETIQKKISDLEENVSTQERIISNQKDVYCERQILMSDIKDNLTRDFQEMRDYLEKQERASFWRIKQEQDTAQREVSEEMQRLIADINTINKLRAELEDQLENDWMSVLKDNGPEDSSRPTSPTKRHYTTDGNRLADTTHAISEIKKSLLSHPLLEQLPCPPKQVFEDSVVMASQSPPSCTQEMERTPPDPEERSVLQWATSVSFDPDTVSSRLALSSDRKTVTVTGKNLPYPKNQRRFMVSQVLCAEGFSEDCNYWELTTNDSSGWGIGAAVLEIGNYQLLGRNDFSWCVEWNKGRLSVWHGNEEIPMAAARPSTVGVLLNLREKVISFYSVTAEGQTLLHSYPLHSQAQVFPAVWLYGLKPGNSLTIRDI